MLTQFKTENMALRRILKELANKIELIEMQRVAEVNQLRDLYRVTLDLDESSVMI